MKRSLERAESFDRGIGKRTFVHFEAISVFFGFTLGFDPFEW